MNIYEEIWYISLVWKESVVFIVYSFVYYKTKVYEILFLGTFRGTLFPFLGWIPQIILSFMPLSLQWSNGVTKFRLYLRESLQSYCWKARLQPQRWNWSSGKAGKHVIKLLGVNFLQKNIWCRQPQNSELQIFWSLLTNTTEQFFWE